MDFQFYLEPPDLTQNIHLEIEALAPLSMVVSQPGTYFRSAAKPTNQMILGLLENAMGIHLEDSPRNALLKELTKLAKKSAGKNSPWKDHPWLRGKGANSGSGFFSLLRHHLSIQHISGPQVEAYDDLCSFHFRTDASTLIGGSRSYDYRMEGLIGKSRTKPASADFGDLKTHQRLEPEEILAIDTEEEQEDATRINTKSMHYFFPRYYVSPKVRGYVIPKSPFQVQIITTPTLASVLRQALEAPAAPLYLGTNDSWVEVNWKNHD